ncbi:hypothetical protein ACFV6D_26320 [Kitasatospora sp. NPDC059812]|uniref:hypothetical protein n=1 Tax=Kitasatospora sp. NPDC059812 TaxID=3346958 RepID=UPI003649B78C
MTSQPASTLRTRLVDQAASDLEENRRRQQELAEEVRMLKQEEALLVDILHLAERYEGLSEPSPLPQQAQDEPVLAEAKRRRASASAPARTPSPRSARSARSARTARTEKTAKTAKPAKAGNTARTVQAGKPARAAAAGKSRQPLLGELLLSLLSGHDEPRLARELRDELLVKHPDRTPTAQVVRNTLESLVAKGSIQRHKQQRSVLYTLAESGRHALAAQEGAQRP